MFYLNAFPHKDGVFQDLSPYTTKGYNSPCTVVFGSYVQTRNLTINNMSARTTGAIAMGPRTNFQGGVKFDSLESAKTLHRIKNNYTITPIPADEILRVT